MYKKILIATDGSELAGRAVEDGLKLAKVVEADVLIVTVTEIWSAFAAASEANQRNYDAVSAYEEAEKHAAEETLRAATDRAASMGVTSDTRHVSDRRPSEGILEIARLEDCDLIVMASHGRRGIQKVLMGSQTSEVIALTDRPVLVIR
jgi:nucleotide-binding universal stress UspA family protein